jgi:hypothetical protein
VDHFSRAEVGQFSRAPKQCDSGNTPLGVLQCETFTRTGTKWSATKSHGKGYATGPWCRQRLVSWSVRAFSVVVGGAFSSTWDPSLGRCGGRRYAIFVRRVRVLRPATLAACLPFQNQERVQRAAARLRRVYKRGVDTVKRPRAFSRQSPDETEAEIRVAIAAGRQPLRHPCRSICRQLTRRHTVC